MALGTVGNLRIDVGSFFEVDCSEFEWPNNIYWREVFCKYTKQALTPEPTALLILIQKGNRPIVLIFLNDWNGFKKWLFEWNQSKVWFSK